MILKGEWITLQRMTREECHDLYSKYEEDPQMTEEEFVYDKNKVDTYFDVKTNESNRLVFSIKNNDEIIGEIQLKRINNTQKEATLSILIANDSYKNKGYGTEAEKLIIDYAFDVLNLNRILADTTKRNNRSKYVLKKLGFKFLYTDNCMEYFELNKKFYSSQKQSVRG